MESYEYGGHLWGLPLDASCHAGIYRDDLVSGDDPPTTWEQTAVWARTHHNPPRQYGLALSVEGALGHCLFLSMMASLGFPAYLDPELPTCDRSAAEYALTTLRDLLAFVHPGSTHWGPWDIYEHFTSQDNVAYCPSIFAYANYFGGTGSRDLLRLRRVPAFKKGGPGRPIIGGSGWASRCHAARCERRESA